ncbi:MAG: hypothetical protein GX597_24265 [Anaerolineaceae bacterium]|nr:hypothetical protein [Anaerolineaceae bacterium]
MKRLAVLLLVLMLLLTAAAPVAADPPQTWYENDFEEDLLVVDCTAHGYDFEVWDHMVYHQSEVGYFGQDGNVVRTLVQTKGVDHLYKSTAPDAFVASGPFCYSQHVQILEYVPGEPSLTLAEVKETGTQWNVNLPNGVAIHLSGQWVVILQGEPPDAVLIDMLRRAGRTTFDEQVICAALAD